MAQVCPYTRNNLRTDDNDNDYGGSSNNNGGDKQNAD